MMFLYLLETLEGAPLSHGGLEKLRSEGIAREDSPPSGQC